MLRSLVVVAVIAAISSPALASGKSEMKAGYASLLRREYERAIAYFTDAINGGDLSRADLALVYQYRGAELLKIDRYDDAIDDFNKALSLEPGLATALNDRGIAYRKKGEYQKAIADYSGAIRLWPDSHGWYFNRGIAYAAINRHDEAIADFDRALFYRPDYAEAFVARGDSLLALGQRNDARRNYENALRKRPSIVDQYPWLTGKLAPFGLTP